MAAMNKVLSLLLAFVFLQTQSWALSGGPVFTSGVGGQQSLIGVYAGALIPENGESKDGSFNGLGLFTLSVPETGLGIGDFVYFSEGRTFTGSITGVADPDKGTLRGLLKGQFDIVVDNIQITDDFFGDAALVQTKPGGFANGQIKANFKAGPSFGISQGGVPFVGLRIDGIATIEVSEFKETVTRVPGPDDGDPTTDDSQVVTSVSVVTINSVRLSVDGFRQSNTPGATSISTFTN